MIVRSTTLGFSLLYFFLPFEAGAESGPVRPEEWQSCGVNSLYIALSVIGESPSLGRIASIAESGTNPITSYDSLRLAAAEYGVTCYGIRLKDRDLTRVPSPAILRLKGRAEREGAEGIGHFVVFLGVDRNGVAAIHDPPFPPQWLPPDKVDSLWDGTALILERNGESSLIVERLRNWAIVVCLLNFFTLICFLIKSFPRKA